jgi:hypothetical protein
MIIINQTTCNQMMADNPQLKTYEDIYQRTYLVGTGAEILVLADDSEAITQINQLMGVSNGPNSTINTDSGSSVASLDSISGI